MTPQTERDWAKLIARSAVHPDHGGDVNAFLVLQEQREAWRAAQPKLCAFCGVKPVRPGRPIPSRPNRYCSVHCSTRGRAEARRKRLIGKREYRKVTA